MILHVLTAVSRPDNLPLLQQSIQVAKGHESRVELEWHRLYDEDREYIGGQHLKNLMIADILNGDWVCILDDDTIMHPKFLRKIYRAYHHHPHVNAIVVSQKRTTGFVMHASPENMVAGKVDAGQAVIRRSFIGDLKIPETYGGDGEWLQCLLFGRDDVLFMPDVLSLHNALSGIDVSETEERMTIGGT